MNKPDPTPCADDIFRNGTPILMVSTGATGGNHPFEEWVQAVAAASGQRVDWHYNGGRAVVKVLGDVSAACNAAAKIPLPDWPSMSEIYWVGVDHG
jgi:hypothetical protein